MSCPIFHHSLLWLPGHLGNGRGALVHFANLTNFSRMFGGWHSGSTCAVKYFAVISAAMIREKIIIADDHPMFRDGMCRLVRDVIPEADLFEAGSMSEVFEHLDTHGPPDLFLLDLLFPGMNPKESLRSLRTQCPEASIVIVSMVDEEATIEKVMAFGADGYIAKSIPAKQMSDAITGVRAGQFIVARSSQTGLSDQMPELLNVAELSVRQREILELICAGKSNKQIGRELALSPFTVRNHISLLFRIFKAQSRKELATKAGSFLEGELNTTPSAN